MIRSVVQEKLIGMIKACSEALAYVNEKLASVALKYDTLVNNYNNNVVLNKPIAGKQTQNISLGTTYGLGNVNSTYDVPIFRFTVGSILRYDRILPFNQVDGTEVVNFQTLVNYVTNKNTDTSGLLLPAYAGYPDGDIVALVNGQPAWILPPVEIPPPNPDGSDQNKVLTVAGNNVLLWSSPLNGGITTETTIYSFTIQLSFNGYTPNHSFTIPGGIIKVGTPDGFELNQVSSSIIVVGVANLYFSWVPYSSDMIIANVGCFIPITCKVTGKYQVDGAKLYESVGAVPVVVSGGNYISLVADTIYYVGIPEIYYMVSTYYAVGQNRSHDGTDNYDPPGYANKIHQITSFTTKLTYLGPV